MQKSSLSPLIFILFFFTTINVFAVTVVDYRFDECIWDGTANEVKDSSLSANHSTSHGAITLVGGKINRDTNFNGSNYVQINDASALRNTASLSFWIKTTQVGNDTAWSAPGLIGVEQAGGGDDIIWGFIDASGHMGIDVGTTTNSILKSTTVINDDVYHNIVITRDKDSGEVKVYVDGNNEGSKTLKTGTIGNTFDQLGVIRDTGNSPEYLVANVDEVKIYDVVLSDSEVQEIYTNENSSKNYDGTDRDEVFCSADSCGSYDIQLNISTYNLSGYSGGQIDSHLEFEQVLATQATSLNLFGSGLIAQINTQGSNNNPYGADEMYLTVMDGYINVPEDGNYTFVVNGDDAVEVLIDNIVVSSWYSGHGRSASPTTDNRISKSTVNLVSGYHKLEFRHHENTGEDSYELHWKKPSSTTYEIVPASNLYHCIPYPPLFEYRFDECDDYNGTTNEVVDSSGNDFHGTSVGSIFLSENGKIYKSRRIGLENDPLVKNAIIANKSPTDIGSVGSISFWYKSKKNWNSSDGVMLIDATKGNKYFFLGLRSNGQLQLWAEDSNDRDFQSRTEDSFSFLMNEWVHIALAWDYTNRRFKIYVNGVLQSLTAAVPFNGVMPDLKNLHIGDISENYTQNSSVYDGVRNSANGEFDEFKAYSGELKQVDVTKVYENEMAGKNIDGSFRSEPFCVEVNVCYTDNFDRTDLGSRWSIIKEQNYKPQISSNKLMLTSNLGSVATGVTLAGEFPSSNNYIEIEFEHNAYGGSGADGVTIALADAAIVNPLIDSNLTNIAGAYGGSLGYANRTGTDGFKGGWLGFGFDEYGNFSNPTEGRHGGPGFRRDSIAVRGHGSGQTGYEYITGTTTLNPQVDNTPIDGYLYKISIDTRSARTMIKVQRDVKDGNGFITLIDWFDATQTAQSPQDFKFSLTGSTGGATNFHSINDLVIRAVGCGNLGEDIVKLSSFFDAWDIFRDITDRKISTKIVSQSFGLSIASLTENSSALQDYNGTVCVRLVGETNSTWNKVELTSNPKDTTFSVNKADKDTRVEIVWKDEVDEACPVSNETNSTMSSDNFAIRADKFNLTLPTLAYAGENFNIDFDASSVLDYNETLGSSFHVESNISKSGCVNGALHVEPFSFENGVKSVDANYSDIGDMNITIKEILGSEFAIVDKNDTNDENRLISPDTKDMTIKPYELNVTNVEYEEGWLYMADVTDINQSVKFSILANDKQHNLVQNFTDTCYSEDVDVKTHFSVENTNSNVKIKYDDATVVNIADINRTRTIPKVSFVNSKADIEYSFNIERDYKTPYEPIKIGLREVSVESSNVAKVENNATVSLDTDFYYGRVKTKDLSTNEQSTPHSLHVEVYKLGKYQQNSLNWYVNEDDNDSNITIVDKKGFLSSSTNAELDNIGNKQASGGSVEFILKHSEEDSFKSYLHVDIPEYLWYSKYNSYNSAVDCGSHPCFEYNYIGDRNQKNINSGKFTGTTVGDDFNATKTKKGVKVFR